MTLRYTASCLLIATAAAGHAQMTVDDSQSPTWLVQNVLLGQGVTASNIMFNGALGNQANVQIGEFSAPGTDLHLDAGIVMASGNVRSDNALFITGSNGPASSFAANSVLTNFTDNDLAQLSGQTINDAAVLEFDFVPTGDSLKFRYVFGSEEYTSYTCSQFNDAFGFFLSGPGITGPFSNGAINIALVPGTSVPISINTVNGGSPTGGGLASTCAAADPNWQANSIYYYDNAGQSGVTVTYDGFTVVMTAFALVQCGVQYHIKLAIGDGFDTTLDSGVFLEAGSFTSTGQVVPTLTTNTVSANDTTMFEGCGVVQFDFHRLGDTSVVDTIDVVIGGTATPGVDYSPAFPNQLIFQQGDSVLPYPLYIPLDADGIETLTLTITQNIVCSGSQVVNTYQFYIDQHPELAVNPVDINGTCGQQYVLDPHLTGGTGQAHYSWSNGATTPTITVSPAVTTTYYFTVTDTCGIASLSDSIVVTMPVYAPVEITVSPTDLIPCLGTDDIAVTGATGGNGTYTYGWTLAGANAGNTATINVPAAVPEVYYVATVTDGCGATATDSVLVGQAPLDPIIITTSDERAICLGDTVTLAVQNVTGGNGVYTYQWTNGSNQAISAADTVQVGVPADAAYMIHVEDQCGYEGDTLIHALIPHPAPFRVDLGADTVICLDQELELQARVTGGSGYYTLAWENQDLDDPLLTVKPTSNATYRVYALDQCGEIVSDMINVGVEGPVADIIATNTGQDDWVFKASTLPTFCRNYRWDLGDGATSRKEIVAHSYLDLEEHWVHLKVVTFTGCEAEDSMLVQPPAHIYFPNAFTPDGDGINELFGPSGHYIDSFEMTIFDRWGQAIFQTDDVEYKWDGKINGTAAPTGMYVFKYKVEGHLFPSIEDYGHVTLLRGDQGE